MSEEQYLDLAQRVMYYGQRTHDDNGIEVRSLFGERLEFDLSRCFPLMSFETVYWVAVIEEMLWMLKGSTDAKTLSARNVRIWDDYASREYLDNKGYESRPIGDLGPTYGFSWRHFGAKYIDCHTDYSGQGIDQIANIIETLKLNPASRKMVLSSWDPAAITQVAMGGCHTMCQFHVNGNRLDCQVYQRSGELYLGLPFNIAQYSLLTYMIAHVVGMTPGKMVHVLGDVHIYSPRFEHMLTQIKVNPPKFPRLSITREIKDIDDFKSDDFMMFNYQS